MRQLNFPEDTIDAAGHWRRGSSMPRVYDAAEAASGWRRSGAGCLPDQHGHTTLAQVGPYQQLTEPLHHVQEDEVRNPPLVPSKYAQFETAGGIDEKYFTLRQTCFKH